MTSNNNLNVPSDDDLKWSPECFFREERLAWSNPLTERVIQLLESPNDTHHHLQLEGDIDPMEEIPEYEIIDQIVSYYLKPDAVLPQNSFDLTDNTTYLPENVEQATDIVIGSSSETVTSLEVGLMVKNMDDTEKNSTLIEESWEK
ncbi:unnamed protein product [Rodentolepis nana]|uniref:NAC domain-containing protein n=1 Tax=Rodentolepis nana TaxID=102285 RepID=A0A0R3T498_RODNA|nr:unnamed protein product [Rodentolepis nana]